MKKRSVLYFDASKTIYTRGIKKAFERNGDTIDFFTYDEFCSNETLRRLNISAWQKERVRKINDMFNYIKTKNYDIILIKAPFKMEHEFFQQLFNYFPNTIKINYNWSSVEKNDFLPYINYFDKIYSFDINDCEKYGIDYYPLFYLPEFEKIGLNTYKEYDISFIGSCVSEGRTEFLQNFIEHIRKKGIRHKFYLYSTYKKHNLKLLFTKPSMFRYVGCKFMPLKEVVRIMKVSISMIDYPMDIQSGLTIRTFETIASGLLLITTNVNIKREPFYNPERIKIIKSDLSDFDLDCIREFKPEWNSSFEEYSVSNWARRITEF